MIIRSLLPTAAALLVATGIIHAQEARPAAPQGSGERRSGGERERNFARGNPLFIALDANKDGVIDDQEIAGSAAALKKLDANHDGKITAEEVRPALRGGGTQPGAPAEAMVTRMMAFDKNNDGKLAKDELPERMQSMLERGDTNKDGFLDKEEIKKLAAAQTPATTTRRAGHDDDDDEHEGGKEHHDD